MKTQCPLLIWMLLVITLVSLPPTAIASYSDAIDDAVQEAVLVEDWRTVAELCGESEKLESSSVLRAIKGHASLALNHNNESLRLFLSVSSLEDLEAWYEWATRYTQMNPNSAVAYYFMGDAYSRLEQWDSAIAAFDKSLAIDPEFPLALNARGAAHCAYGLWDRAKSDFERVCDLAPSFADGLASLGTYHLFEREIDAAGKAYESALNTSLNSVLIHNGLGCVKFKKGKKYWDAANKEFEVAGRYLDLSLVYFNADVLNQAAVEVLSKATLYFEPDEISDWGALREVIQLKSSILYPYFQNITLPREIDRAMIDILNGILEDHSLYDENETVIMKLIGSEINDSDSMDIGKLINETTPIRRKVADELDAYEKSLIRGLNRGLLEELFPSMIARADTTEAGMSLIHTGGITQSGFSYRQSLPTQQLQAAKFRMQYTYRPIATALQSIPIIGHIGTGWNQHLNNSIGHINTVLASRGVSTHSGGVSTQEQAAYFFRADEWPVANWFGLGYHVEPRER